MTEEMIDLVLTVHLKGAFNVTQPAYILMREQGYGRIINTTSGAGLFGNSRQLLRRQGELIGFTRTLAVEGASKGIKANAVAPMAYTPMTGSCSTRASATATRPELVSPVVALLASEACPVNGGDHHGGHRRVMRTFIATTAGYTNSDLTVEDLSANWARVMDSEEYVGPSSAMEEQQLLYRTTLSAG